MYKIIMLFLVGLAFIGCTPKPFAVRSLAQKNTKIQQSDPRLINNFFGIVDEGMADRYKRAKKPSFALINGFYTLPVTKPFGAASIVQRFSYQTYIESVEVTQQERSFAIEPISGDDALAFNQALNLLLDNGVRIKELSMSDAVAIAKEENNASQNKKSFALSKVLPPNVDYLMSIYRTTSIKGPVLVGRVIKKDGTLYAFRVFHQETHKNMVSNLITSLFEDTIRRI